MFFNNGSLQFLLLTGILNCLPVFADETPTPQQALQNFGINAEQITNLERGEIIAYEIPETGQKELAIGVAMILPVALPQIINYIKQDMLTATESGIIASAPLTDKSDITSFKKFAFTNKHLDEAKAFLNAEPGDKFNLSKPELDRLKSLQPSLTRANNKTLLKKASQKYRELLLQRWQAYRKSGLSGIAVYSRENGTVDPAEELRKNAINSKVLTRYFPELQQVWQNYPGILPPNSTEQFLWMNSSVEGRPTAILTHRIMVSSESGGILLSRQFYVGHSYDSSQVAAGGLPYKEGTLVFYSSRSATGQVAGIGSSLKRLIGREQMKQEMINRLQRLNKDLIRKSVLTSSNN